MSQLRVAVVGGLMVAAGLLTGCAGKPKEVSYSADVHPILEKKCAKCHTPPNGKGYQTTGLSMASYDDLMKGTKFGPVVKSGDSFTSAVVMLIEGRADPSIKMPHGEEALSDDEIQVIKSWIDQGAKNN